MMIIIICIQLLLNIIVRIIKKILNSNSISPLSYFIRKLIKFLCVCVCVWIMEVDLLSLDFNLYYLRLFLFSFSLNKYNYCIYKINFYFI